MNNQADHFYPRPLAAGPGGRLSHALSANKQAVVRVRADAELLTPEQRRQKYRDPGRVSESDRRFCPSGSTFLLIPLLK